MLIRSRSRGPLGPEPDYLCGNVFYIPQNLPNPLPQSLPQNLPPPRRPNSAVERRPMKPKKPLCAIKTPKRVIQGSTFDAKQVKIFFLPA